MNQSPYLYLGELSNVLLVSIMICIPTNMECKKNCIKKEDMEMA